jgi:hypothetical protein
MIDPSSLDYPGKRFSKQMISELWELMLLVVGKSVHVDAM